MELHEKIKRQRNLSSSPIRALLGGAPRPAAKPKVPSAESDASPANPDVAPAEADTTPAQPDAPPPEADATTDNPDAAPAEAQ